MWEFVRIILRVFIVGFIGSTSYEGKSFIVIAVVILFMLLIYFNLISQFTPNYHIKFNKLEN